MSKEDNNEIIDKTSNFINDYTKIITQFLKNISGKNLGPKYKLSTEFILEVLKRFNANSIAVNNLLVLLKNNFTLIHPIGLLIRSSLLDFIMLMYLNSKNNSEIINDKEWIESQLKIIYSNQLNHTLKDFDKQYINPKLTQLKDLLAEKFPSLIIKKEGIYNIKHKGKISTYDMILKMKNNSYTKPFVGVYERWSFYSKYEHYGVLTYDIQRVDEIIILSGIAKSIWTILIGIMNCFNMVPQINDKINIDSEIKDKLELVQIQFTIFLIIKGILKTVT